METSRNSRRPRCLALALAWSLLAVFAASANAELVWPGPHPSYPDLNCMFGLINYTASTGELQMLAFTAGYNDPSGYASDSFPCEEVTVAATLSPSSLAPTAANGAVAFGDLLTGTIVQAGFAFGVEIIRPEDGSVYRQGAMDYEFVVTGGSLASDFGGLGATVATNITLYYDSNLDSFDVPFGPDGYACDFCLSDPNIVSDTFSVPEPGTLGLAISTIVAGLAAFVVRRR
jgi:hypothetical protein